jgi:D-alanyl-D-alanine carboxypeptidase-like protein
MALVIIPVTRPAILDGQSNGLLDAGILQSTAGLDGGPVVRLAPTATRCWRALSGTALTAGLVLRATSVADSYRSYQQQLTTWLDRYEPDAFSGYIGTRWWPDHYDLQGRFVVRHLWYQKPTTAVAAWPGSSNHGWGLAVDIAGASGARLDWLERHAVSFGWSWEISSEPWHVHNFSGDAIPQAVLDYEEEHMSVWDERLPNPAVDGRLDPAGDYLRYANNYAADAAQGVADLASRMHALEARLDQVLSLLQSGTPVPGEVDLTDTSVSRVVSALGAVITGTTGHLVLDAGGAFAGGA